MFKRMLLIAASASMMSTGALANATCPVTSSATLGSALSSAVQAVAGKLGLGLNMWATVVANDGTVCAVAYTGTSGSPLTQAWLASRVISAQKAFTAMSLSLGLTGSSGSGTALATGKLALSTANLYTATQPGGSLFGLQESNPVFAAGAYGDTVTVSSGVGASTGPLNTANYGTDSDPMKGVVIGGINVFGGGLALYQTGSATPTKVGGVGVSGDTSCTDHLVAWWTRRNLNLDYLGGVNGVSGDSTRPDNIVFDITMQTGQMPGVSASGWGHPACNNTNSAATTIAKSLPTVRTPGAP